MISLLVPLVLIGLVVYLIRRSHAKPGAAIGDPHGVRRLFQYAVLYGLLVVVANGLSGLLGRLLERDLLVVGDEASLARDLSFLVVGGPLLAGVAVWSRRQMAADPAEARSPVWAWYAGIAALTSLLVAAAALRQVLGWAVGLEEWRGVSLAQALVWGSAWAVHWWLDARVTPRPYTQLHQLAGSLIGLVTAAIGLGGLLLGALRPLMGLEGSAVIASGDNPMLRGLVVLVVGAPIWLLYWSRAAARERDTWWFSYVLLAGVGGGLVTAVVSGSGLIYSVLVWTLGDAGSASAAEHFDGAPTADRRGRWSGCWSGGTTARCSASRTSAVAPRCDVSTSTWSPRSAWRPRRSVWSSWWRPWSRPRQATCSQRTLRSTPCWPPSPRWPSVARCGGGTGG